MVDCLLYSLVVGALLTGVQEIYGLCFERGLQLVGALLTGMQEIYGLFPECGMQLAGSYLCS